MELIEPRNLKGFHDYLPAEQSTRAAAIVKIKQVFERFGFEPLETPALEYEDVLAGKYGDEGEKLMYRFTDHGERRVAMRYDLTVPLARVVAQHGADLPKPFKRYQVAPVWRAENTQKGRYREFYQCDVDVIGAEVGVPDAECIALVEQVMLSLGLKKFVIQLNNRKILNGIIAAAGVAEDQAVDAIRIVDKLLKIGEEAVADELVETVKVDHTQAKRLIRLVSTKVGSIAELESFVKKNDLEGTQAREGLKELSAVFSALQDFGVGHVEIDLSLARGLDYYTSTVIETVITETAESRKYGSVSGGGRYDKLLHLFTGKDVPSVGVSVGIDRLLPALEELGLLERSHVTEVLVLNMDALLKREYLKMVAELRAAGVNAEVFYGQADMKKQFKYAEQKGIPFAVLYGEDEHASGQVTVRNLTTREQESVKRADLVNRLRR